jgi:formylglycine-generating enzyme required for sulfatase activity
MKSLILAVCAFLAAVLPSRGMEVSLAGETREFGGIEMVWCPPGQFLMGSPAGEEGREDNETQHRVTLTKGFWMAKTETSQAQWESVMGTNVAELKRTGIDGETYGDVNATGPEVAMYFTSWDDAQK